MQRTINALPLHQTYNDLSIIMKKKKVKLRDLGSKEHQGENGHESGHNHSGTKGVSKFKTYLPAIFSFVMLIIGIAVDYFDTLPFFKGWIRVAWYTLAYLPVLQENMKGLCLQP